MYYHLKLRGIDEPDELTYDVFKTMSLCLEREFKMLSLAILSGISLSFSDEKDRQKFIERMGS